jgi:hypothetical protein
VCRGAEGFVESKEWAVKLERPDRTRIEQAMKAYSRVVRTDTPPKERKEFAITENDRMKTIN